jgi:hypothetical protein
LIGLGTKTAGTVKPGTKYISVIGGSYGMSRLSIFNNIEEAGSRINRQQYNPHLKKISMAYQSF